MSDPTTIILDELLDRTRRIETRLTRYMETNGFDTGVRRPSWEAGKVIVRSMDTSVKDILAVIPDDWEGRVLVVHHKSRVMTILPLFGRVVVS